MSLSIGQNPGYIHNIESGKSMPSLPAVFYICEYLNISVSDFFDQDIQEPSRLAELTGLLKKLNTQQLDAVCAVVRELAKK